MYFPYTGSADYKFAVDIDDVEKLKKIFPMPSKRGCTDEYAVYFDQLLQECGKTAPNTTEEALDAINYLLDKL